MVLCLDLQIHVVITRLVPVLPYGCASGERMFVDGEAIIAVPSTFDGTVFELPFSLDEFDGVLPTLSGTSAQCLHPEHSSQKS